MIGQSKRHIALFLLLLLASVIVEKAIPHAHVESHGITVPHFSDEETDSEQSNHNEHEEENLHASAYELTSFTPSFLNIVIEVFLYNDCFVVQDIQIPHLENYNILPKILNAFIVHTYSSKAPPFKLNSVFEK